MNWAMTTLADKGFTPVVTPDFVRESVADACGFQARGDHTQVYHVKSSELVLIGTAELPLAARYMNTIIPEMVRGFEPVFAHVRRRVQLSREYASLCGRGNACM